MVIDDENRHKPYGKTAWVPVDDVYILRYYPRTIYDAAEAVDMLKNFQKLDFTPHEQPVYIDLRLNMKLEKKVFTFSSLRILSVFMRLPYSTSELCPSRHFRQNRRKILANLLWPAQSETEAFV